MITAEAFHEVATLYRNEDGEEVWRVEAGTLAFDDIASDADAMAIAAEVLEIVLKSRDENAEE